MVYFVRGTMSKKSKVTHKFREEDIETSYGDRNIVYRCENCGELEDDVQKECDQRLLYTYKVEYLEKALKAVAMV